MKKTPVCQRTMDTLRRFYAEVFTIPNLLSVIRMLLIPEIHWLYGKQQYIAAAGVVLLSGLTDLLDGWIARKFHAVSELGKILDPLADKLTQGILLVCLLSRYPWCIWLLVFFIAKELVQLVCVSVKVYTSGKIQSANRFGKISTAVMYIVMLILILFPSIPEPMVMILCAACGTALLASLISYSRIDTGSRKSA